MEPETEIWDVEEWLDRIGMSQYAEDFVDNGYETPELVSNMKSEDMDAVGITNKKDRGILFTQARLLLEVLPVKKTVVPPLRPSPVPPLRPSPAITLTTTTGSSLSPTTPTSTSGYSEPWENTSSRTPLHSPIGADGYSEPWNAPTPNGISKQISASSVGEAADGKPPPLPPPNKAGSTKGKKPPPSPGTKLPEYKREDGGKGFTKLQLKLKIREELQKDSIVLSEGPFCKDDGSQNDDELMRLASDYAERFSVESLGVYDALVDVWRHTNNKSDFVIPSKVLMGGSSEKYEEPFDCQLPLTIITVPPESGSPPKNKNTKNNTLAPTANYEEPFDTVLTPKVSPQPKIDQSKTLPSPKIRKKSKEESEDKTKEGSSSKGLGRLFKRKEKVRSQSVKEDKLKVVDDDTSLKGKKQAKISFPDKSKSTKVKKRLSEDKGKHREEGEETVADMVVTRGGSRNNLFKSSRASVAGYPVHNGSTSTPLKHRQSFNSVTSTASDTSEGNPSQRKEPLETSDSEEDNTPPALRRLKQLSSKNTGSDVELNKHSDNEDSKDWMQASKSYDNLAEVINDTKPEKKTFLSRLRNFRKSVTPAVRKSSKNNKHKTIEPVRRSNELRSSRLNSLTASISMPDIAGTNINLSVKQPPSTIHENILILNNSPPKPIRFSKHPKISLDGEEDKASTPKQVDSASTASHELQIQACSAPTTMAGFLSEQGSDSSVPIVRTKSSGSAKSLDLQKPPPPPKPVLLAKKPKPARLTRQVPQKPAKLDTPSSNTLANSAAKNEKTVNEPTAKAPPKPMRRSIKRGGVTEQRKKQLIDESNTTSSCASSSKETNETMSSTKTDNTSSSQSSPVNDKSPPASSPPPKPSRNYKSIKILSPKNTTPDKSFDSPSAPSSKSDIKPGKVIQTSQSAAPESPGHTPSLSQGSGSSQDDRQVPKLRTSADSRKPPPPNKPPRNSIKLKTMN